MEHNLFSEEKTFYVRKQSTGAVQKSKASQTPKTRMIANQSPQHELRGRRERGRGSLMAEVVNELGLLRQEGFG